MLVVDFGFSVSGSILIELLKIIALKELCFKPSCSAIFLDNSIEDIGYSSMVRTNCSILRAIETIGSCGDVWIRTGKISGIVEIFESLAATQ